MRIDKNVLTPWFELPMPLDSTSAEVIVIFGPSGSGKTTVAQKIERETGATRYSHDDWMVRLHGNNPPAEHFKDYAAQVSAMINDLWPRSVVSGHNVVLDCGHWKRAERDETRQRARQLGAKIRLIDVQCDYGIRLARVLARNSLPGSLYITKETLDVLDSRIEPLADEEERETIVQEPEKT